MPTWISDWDNPAYVPYFLKSNALAFLESPSNIIPTSSIAKSISSAVSPSAVWYLWSASTSKSIDFSYWDSIKSFWRDTCLSCWFNFWLVWARSVVSVFNNLSSSNSLELIIELVLFNSFWEFANSNDILFNVSFSVFISKLSCEISVFICKEFVSIDLISLETELISLFKFAANSFDLLKSSRLNELLIFVNSELYCFWRFSFFSFNKFIWSARGLSFVFKLFIWEIFWLTAKFLFSICDCKLDNSLFNFSESSNLAVSSVILELELKLGLWPFNPLSFAAFKAIVSVNSNLFEFKLFISSLILLLCNICSFKLLLSEDISVFNKADCCSALRTPLFTFSSSFFNFSDNSIDFWSLL